MPRYILRARYTDEPTIMRELGRLFPLRDIRLDFERGRYICTVPYKLSDEQYEALLQAIQIIHTEGHY